MTDDLDNLKAMMTAATPKPNAAKRAENLALAQKNFESLQGSTAQLRLTLVTGLQGLWTGVTTMLSNMTSRGGLTTTSAFVACGFLFLTPTGQDVWQAPRLSSPTIISTDSEVLVEESATADEDVATSILDNAPAPTVAQTVAQAPSTIMKNAVQPTLESEALVLQFDESTALIDVGPAAPTPPPRMENLAVPLAALGRGANAADGMIMNNAELAPMAAPRRMAEIALV
ncbi:MAG: Ca-activated chloride channel family protein, partial [Yoonia sp.]